MATPGDATSRLGPVLSELQSYGARVERGVEGRRSGAGPADAGMIWVEDTPVTFPFTAEYVTDSPFVLREGDDGWELLRDGRRIAAATVPPRPRIYDLQTAEGVPYWQIALLHLDSLASTVVQTCMHWGTDDQCTFCGIELSLEAGVTIPVKRPEQLAEVAVAARDLDGAVDVTLTTGTTRGADKGALYLGKCARAIKEASGLPVQAQFEPPDDLGVLETVKEMGVDVLGMHVESFDSDVLARVAPPKARTGIDGYFRAWERAVEIFGRGQVSTYVILGMGEDPDTTVDACKRAVDIGVYPFVVPLRPVPGSLMDGWLPPEPGYVESLYRRIGPYVVSRGVGSWNVTAGCARCQACSALSAFEETGDDVAPRQLPILQSD
ncbi:MAG: MSMEG_0568 family radical SAM protein [Actinomycetota bacterium]|nr:MSMEG_0568 family radical SAM protein [Actinomycetota bacterium]